MQNKIQQAPKVHQNQQSQNSLCYAHTK